MPGQKAAEAERRGQIVQAAFDVAVARGLEGLTVRRVAAQAGLSHGLVHFHFRTKAELLAALLDWLLATTVVAPAAALATDGTPAERLVAQLTGELARATADRRRVHLFFDFWLLGTREPRIRARMRVELARYRAAFRPVVEDVLRAEPQRFAGVTAEGLVSVLVAFVKGAAVQSVIDARGFDADAFTAAATALLAQSEPVLAWPAA